jgi:uncharacterized protein (DUF433 family)
VSLLIEPQIAKRVPLTPTESGVVLVEGTRVPLDLIVDGFNDGQSAEEIALGYPAVDLVDIYVVLAYYLHHREDVDHYIAERRQQADELRRDIESHFPPQGIRDRLLARRRSSL